MRMVEKKGSSDEPHHAPHDRYVLLHSLLPKHRPEFHASFPPLGLFFHTLFFPFFIYLFNNLSLSLSKVV